MLFSKKAPLGEGNGSLLGENCHKNSICEPFYTISRELLDWLLKYIFRPALFKIKNDNLKPIYALIFTLQKKLFSEQQKAD